MGLALLWLEQSLEEAPSPGIVWSNCCMMGWAGHLSPGKATLPWGSLGCLPCLDHRAWPRQDKLHWCPVPQTRALCQKSAHSISPVLGKRYGEHSKRRDFKAQQTGSQAGLSDGTAWCQLPQNHDPSLHPWAPHASQGQAGGPSPHPGAGQASCACRRAESHAPT